MKMDPVERSVRRISLKSLAQPTPSEALKKQHVSALLRLDDRATGENSVDLLKEQFAPRRQKRGSLTEADARRQIDLTKALYAARRISTHQYVMLALSPVENIHSHRWLSGKYDSVLGPISQKIHAIEKQNGLNPSEYWKRTEGPEEHIRLNREYESFLDQKFGDALIEFDLLDIAKMYRDTRTQFDQLRERGRRSVFHDGEYVLALKDLVFQYEREARQAADSGAYTVAIAGLAAGIEGLLLLRCLKSPSKASKTAKSLPRRPKSANDPRSWTFETLIDVCLLSGWLPAVETSIAKYDTAGLSHILRQMRNYIHPARRARDKPWAETDERDFRDAEAIYFIVRSVLSGRRTS